MKGITKKRARRNTNHSRVNGTANGLWGFLMSFLTLEIVLFLANETSINFVCIVSPLFAFRSLLLSQNMAC